MADKIITGIVASPGIRIGVAYLFKGAKVVVPKYTITDAEIESEIARLDSARQKTKDEINVARASCPRTGNKGTA